MTLCINGGKISARILKNALVKLLRKMEQMKREQRQAARTSRQQKEPVEYHGKQSMEKLMKQNCQITNIEVTDGNIKSFEKYARKYNIDFSLKKDTSVSPPRYYVFFKAKDKDQLQPAFKEFTAMTLDREKRPTIRERLAQAQEQTKTKHREREKVKAKDREVAR